MNARRYTVRLYWHGSRRTQEDRNLNPLDDTALRAVLEDMVKADMGTLDVDLSKWRIDVHSLGGGRIVARCGVAGSGATQVRR